MFYVFGGPLVNVLLPMLPTSKEEQIITNSFKQIRTDPTFLWVSAAVAANQRLDLEVRIQTALLSSPYFSLSNPDLWDTPFLLLAHLTTLICTLRL